MIKHSVIYNAVLCLLTPDSSILKASTSITYFYVKKEIIFIVVSKTKDKRASGFLSLM